MSEIYIRFDGPPGPVSGRFIEVERDGASISIGEWRDDGDDCLLVLTEFNELLKALQDIADGMASMPNEVLEKGRPAVTAFMWNYSQERAREALAEQENLTTSPQ